MPCEPVFIAIVEESKVRTHSVVYYCCSDERALGNLLILSINQ